MTGLDPATARPPLTSGVRGGSWPQQSGQRRSHMSPAAHAYLARLLGPEFSCPSDKKSSSFENSRRIFLSLSLFFFPLSMHLSSKQIPEIKNVIVVNMVSACCKCETDARVESWAASPPVLSSVVWKVPAGAHLFPQRHSPPHPTPRHAPLREGVRGGMPGVFSVLGEEKHRVMAERPLMGFHPRIWFPASFRSREQLPLEEEDFLDRCSRREPVRTLFRVTSPEHGPCLAGGGEGSERIRAAGSEPPRVGPAFGGLLPQEADGSLGSASATCGPGSPAPPRPRV